MNQEVLNVGDFASMKSGKGFNDIPVFKGKLFIRLKDSDGQLKEEREITNTVTTAGKEGIADQLLASPSVPKPGWMEVGTGSPAATKLGAYIASSRTALSSKTRSGAVVTMVCTFGAGVGTGAITEAGIFGVVTQDTAPMYCSASFSVINKAAGDSLEITWTLTAS